MCNLVSIQYVIIISSFWENCPSFDKTCYSWEKIFSFFKHVFSNYGYYLPLEMHTTIQLNLAPSALKAHCVKFVWNRSSALEKNSKCWQCCYYLPMEKGVAFYLNKLKFAPFSNACSNFRQHWFWQKRW